MSLDTKTEGNDERKRVSDSIKIYRSILLIDVRLPCYLKKYKLKNTTNL